MHSPLPVSWVEKLFERFTARYGDAWLRKWEGIDMAAVKADWSEELAGLQNHPDALKYALQYLPVDWPPNVQQFKAICNRAPTQELPALPEPVANPDRVSEIVAGLAKVAGEMRSNDWPNRLRAREVALERLTPFQRNAWREALQTSPSAPISAGEFTPPPRDVLPPGMRA